MNLLSQYEQFVGLPPKDATRLLGVAYSTYCLYRSGKREIPRYVGLHIDLVMRQTPRAIDALIRDRLGNENG